MAGRLRPPHLLPGQSVDVGGSLLFESRLESWQQAVENGRGRLWSIDKLAALVLTLAIVFAQIGFGVGAASADVTFVVNSTADVVDLNQGNGVCDTGNLVGPDPECTLRAAVQEANALAGTDTISVPAGTYTLTLTGTGENVAATGDLDILDSVIVTGVGAGVTVVDGNLADRVFEIRGTAQATISGLTIDRGGESTNGSSALVNSNTTMVLDSVVVSGGIAGTAVYNLGTLDVTDTRITGNSSNFNGAGIYTAGLTTITDSLIDNNTSSVNGGGIYVGSAGDVSLTNVTLSGNSGSVGGAMFNEAQVDLVNVTVSGNDATQSGGLHANGGAVTTLLNSVVFGNTSTDNPDANGSFTSLGYNIIGVVGGSTGWIGSDRIGVDPQFQALADNGGPTPTHALTAGSEAIDTGTTTGAPAADQRGVARDASPDIGAYEFSSPISNVVTVNSTGDATDASPGDDVCSTGGTNSQGNTECTLRAAIAEANASTTVDTIEFDMPTTEAGHSGGVWTIAPVSEFPGISAAVTLDGTTQTGATANTGDFPSNINSSLTVRLSGASATGTDIDGLILTTGSSGSVIRGLSITDFTQASDEAIVIWDSSNNVVAGNHIGVGPAGTTVMGNRAAIFIGSTSSSNRIGGTSAGDRNLIAGSTEGGIVLSGAGATGTLIEGNDFGLLGDGTAAGNGWFSVASGGGATATVGGTAAGAGNRFANGYGGVGPGALSGDATITILGNHIWANSSIGIDLAGDGVTVNDSGDGDTGANDLLNFPVITSANETAGTISIDFDLDVPAGDYRIEFFTNSSADPSGYGEGETYIASYAVAGHPGGVASYSTSFPGAGGDIISATTTEDLGGGSYGSTSEFSAVYTATSTAGAMIVSAADDDATTAVDIPVVVNPGVNDVDVNGDAIDEIDVTDPANGAAVINGDGTVTYTPDPAYAGLDSFDYWAIDSGASLGHYWGLAGTGTDAVGSADGSVTGAVATAGAFGQGLSFDEFDDRVTIPDFSYGSEWSLSFWFRVGDNSGTSYQYMYSHGDPDWYDSVNVLLAEIGSAYPNMLRTSVRDSNDLANELALDVNVGALVGDGLWHVYTVTADSSSGVSVYIDGVLEANDPTHGTGAINPSGSAFLGTRQNLDFSRFYGGRLDTVQVYGRALESTEVADLAAEINVGTVSLTVASPQVFVVNSTGDAGDINPGDDVCDTGAVVEGNPECTLRAALEEANALPAGDTISFAIPTSDPGYSALPLAYTFTPATPYPVITNPVILDATTQSGYAGEPIIQLDGSSAVGSVAGLVLNTSDSTIKGFIVHSFDDDGLESSGSTGYGDNNVFTNNWVGIDAGGVTRPNADHGILITTNASNNVIGGTGANDGNVVVGATNTGISIRETSTATVLGNSVSSSGGLGIDLEEDGVTANDPGDGDTGSNGLLNHPVLTAAVAGSGTVNVSFDLDVPAGDYRIEFFENTSADPTGYGEGETPIGSYNVVGHPGGSASYVAGVPGSPGDIITATTTGEVGAPFGFTSEFSNAATAIDAVLVVNSTGDGSDANPGNGICSTGGTNSEGAPECTLRAAIDEANAAPDADDIEFSIPVSDPGYSATNTYWTIQPGSSLAVTQPVTIDAATQPGYTGTPDIMLDGSVAAIGTDGFEISGDNVTVRGFAIASFPGTGVYLPATSDGATVESSYIGTDITGTLARPHGFEGIWIESATNVTVGGTGAGNLISGNATAAVGMFGASGVDIIDNLIGTTADGLALLGNGSDGVDIQSSSTVLVDGNVVSGSTGDGIIVWGSTNTTIINNYLGTDATGNAPIPNTQDGVHIGDSSTGTVVGQSGAGNVISGNGDDGVALTGSGVDNSVVGNSIFGNGGLGIDLGDDGVTANDGGDVDTGPNDLLNFPVITAAYGGGGSATVEFTLDVPAGDYRIEFFTVGAADPSGHGEGETPAGQYEVVAHPGGSAAYSASVTAAIGDILTATSTESTVAPFGSTSEFSAAATVDKTTFVVNSTGDGSDSNPGDGVCDTGSTNTAGAPACTLRAAIEEANALGGADTIEFDMPSTEAGHSAGVWTIQPSAALPAVGAFTTIDGTTQTGYVANTNTMPSGLNGTQVLVVNGSAAGSANGLDLSGNGSIVRGLVVNGFNGAGLAVTGDDVVVSGVYVGTDSAGSAAVANSGTGLVVGGARATIGGANPEDRFLASGNTSDGIRITGADARVDGGVVGAMASTAGTLANGGNGITVDTTTGAQIGTSGLGNIVAGNNLVDAAGILVNGGSGHTIEANLIGTNGAGAALGNTEAGIEIAGASGVVVGGTGAGERNVIADNRYGVAIDAATGNSVVGNYIGVNLSGSVDLGNTDDGVVLRNGAGGNTIGGPTAAHRNIIAGNNNDGVWITGATTNGNSVQGNWIGFGADGSVIPNLYHGIAIESAAYNNVIGGPGGGEGNRIGNAGWDGVTVSGGGTGNTILGNAVASSGDLGIDLSNDGVTVNDGGDVDSGSNDLLNYPVITSAVDTSGTVSVDFDLDVPAGDYRIEFFASTVADATGYGEGETFVASYDVVGHPGGRAPYSTSLTGSAGDLLTATTTEAIAAPFGSTSEFSAAVSIVSSVFVVNSTGDGGDADPGNGACDTGGTNSAGADECTLRAAIQETEAITGADVIEFAMPATEPGHSGGVWTITPVAAYPSLTEQVSIDARTQPGWGGTPVVEISGTSTTTALGVDFQGPDSVLAGIAVGDYTQPVVAETSGFTLLGTWIGVRADGVSLWPVGPDEALRLVNGASDAVVGGAGPSDGNVLVDATNAGIYLSAAHNATIQGNYIGVLPDGVTPAPNGAGITMGTSANGLTIGGAGAGEGNVIAANTGIGIDLAAPSDGTRIIGNSIGVDAGSNAEGNGGDGISISSASTGVVVSGNQIANSGAAGIAISNASALVSVTGNSIEANTRIGIDLNADGVTANDAGDGDTGPNGLLNFPVIDTATATAGTISIDGTWDLPAGWYQIEVFVSGSADPSGYGEGSSPVGTTIVSHTGGGDEPWSTAVPGSAGDVVTATATGCSDATCNTVTHTSEFSAAVTVLTPDTTPPVITLVGSNPQVIDVGSPYVELGATALDDRDGDLTGSIVVDASAVNTSVVGSYPVTYNVTDSSGNAATEVTRTVDVVDTTLPVITLVGSNPQVIEVGSGYVELGATASDNYDGDLTGSIVIDASAVNTSLVGSYTVVYNVVDSNGNPAMAFRTVDVVDTTLPVITLVGADPQGIEVGSPYVELGATATDNYDGDLTGSIVIDASAVTTSVVGSYPVTYDVSDVNGNAAVQVVRIVDVVDTTLPVVTLVGANPQVIEVGSPYVELGATASDKYDGDLTGSIVTDTGAVNIGVVGSYPVTYNVTDSNGNAAVEVTRTVDVVDTTLPVITLAGSNPQIIEVGSPYVELGATATDNYDGDLTGSIVIDASAVNTSVVGSYPVRYNVGDSSGNSAVEVIRTVDIVDTTVPIITLVGSNPQTIEVASPYVELGATAQDTGDGDLTGSIVIDTSALDTATVGVYPVTYDVTDSQGNPAVQQVRSVHVVDTTLPVTTLAGANPQVIEVGSAYVELGATASDNYDGDLTESIVIDASAVNTSVVGSYPVTYDVTDSNGNAAVQMVRTVDVVDTTLPVITLVGSNPQVIDVGSPYVELGATATDTYDGDLTGSIVIDATAVNTSAVGSYPVTYDVTDSSGNAANTGVRTVDVVNAAPTLGALTNQTGAEQTPVTFTATAGDPDPSDTLSFSLSGAPAGASIDPVAGDFTWTPTEAQGPNVYNFDVVVTDSGSPALSDSGSVTVTVNEVNSAPTLSPVGVQNGDELAPISFSIPAGDPDIPGNTLTFILSGAPAGATIDPSGLFSWTPTEAQGPGSYSFDVSVSDDGSPSLGDSTPVTVSVGEVNSAPAVSSPGARVSNENDTVSLAIWATDGDLPTNTLSYSASNLPPGLVIDPATGVITGTIAYTANASSPYAAVVTATDDGSPNRSGQTTFSWTVADTNRPPVANSDSVTAPEDTYRVFDVLNNDTDPDGDLLTIVNIGTPGHGSASISGGGIAYRPSLNYNGADQLSYTVSDGRGGVAVATLNITVTPVNDTPQLSPISSRTGPERQSISFTATASDVEGDTVTYTLTGAPAGASIDPAGSFSWTPGEAQGPGTYTFSVTATDNGSPVRSASTGVTINVTEVNQAPVVGNPADQHSEENETVTLDISAGDNDVPADTLYFTASGLPSGLSINAVTGRISGTLPFDASSGSPYSVSVTVSDDGTPQKSSTAWFSWYVDNTNRAPIAQDITVDAEAGLPSAVVLAGSDPDGDALTYQVAGRPTKGTLSGGPRYVQYTPNVTASGTDIFTYSVSDGELTAFATVTVTITPNYAPVGGPDEYVVRRGGRLVVASPGVLADDRDPEGNRITASVVTEPDDGSLSLGSTGGFVYTHDGGPGDLDSFVYIVDDGMRESVPVSVKITIEENRAPVANNDTVSLNEDEAVSFRPLDNDTDANNEPVKLAGITQPSNGTVTWNQNGSITYRPNKDFNGSDAFSYEVTDGDLSSIGNVTVVIRPVNDTPDAVNASAMGRSGEMMLVDLRGTVTDVDGDSLTYLLEAPPSGAVRQVEPGVFEIDLSGIVRDIPALAYVVTDPSGARATALLKVAIEIPAELVGVPSLVSDNVSVSSLLGGDDSKATGDKTSLVAGLRLMIGSVLGTFQALRIPVLILALILAASLFLGFSRRFAFSSTPTALPLGEKRRVDIVMALSRAGVPARTEPGSHQSVLYRFGPEEVGVTTTGARTMVRSEVWVEVETPEGDGWVNSEFITEQVSCAVFREDDRPAMVVADLIDRIYGSDDLLPVTAGHDLHVALHGPPVRFSANSLKRLLLGASVYWWWGAMGDAPKTQSTFAEEVGESVAAAYRNRDVHFVEHRFPVPLEFVNLHSLVVGNHEHGEGWRIFFRYENGEPSVAGLMRETASNPAAMHGIAVRQLV